jgi:hypothetical protein
VTTCQPEQAAMLNGRWLWLFPAAYAVHIVEEGLAGEHFLLLDPPGDWTRDERTHFHWT